MRRRSYMTGSREQTDVVVSHLAHLLAYLRAMYLSYQTSHWQTKGPAYYGNHLLFQRLYESVQGEIDALAEKIVGYVGPAGVNLDGQVGLVNDIASGLAATVDHHVRGLESEVAFQRHVKAAYDAIKAAGVMTLGLDDFLMATASAHETNQYLLQQVLNTGGAARVARTSKKVPTAESYFFDNPERREVREFAHSKANSNVPAIANVAGRGEGLGRSELAEERVRARIAPPTPTDIREQPGADEFGTLNRYLVETEQPTDPGVPQGHKDVRKHRRIDPSNDDIILVDATVIDPSGDDYDDDGHGHRLASWTFALRS
jgi:DNA-binding ferritin-like protein